MIAEPKKMNIVLFLVALTVSLNTMQFGYNIAVFNIPQKVLTSCVSIERNTNMFDYIGLNKCVKFSDDQYSTLTSLLALGGVVGTLMGSFIASSLGRKKLLVLNSVLYAIFTAIQFAGNHVTTFFVSRFVLGGLGGFALILVPIYLAEIAPINLRGILGMFTSFSIVGGIIMAQTIGIFFSSYESWRYIFFLQLIMSIINLLLVLFCPESHVYLIKKSLTPNIHSSYKLEFYKQAENALRFIRREVDVSHELAVVSQPERPVSITTSGNNNETDQLLRTTEIKRDSIFSIFSNEKYRLCVIFVMFIHITQQFSGINAIMYYSTNIFEPVFGYKSAQYITILINVLQLIMNFFTGKVIEVYGRKKLMTLSCLGMGVMLSVVAVSINIGATYVLISGIFLAIAFYALALGPIPFLLVPEIIDKQNVEAAGAIAVTTNMLFNFFVAKGFPVVSNLLAWPSQSYKGNSFLLFSAYLIISAFIIHKVLPETKQKEPRDTMVVLKANIRTLFSK